jgi:hypothetical protein
VREQALHPPGGAGAARGEEDEHRTAFGHVILQSNGGAGRRLPVERPNARQRYAGALMGSWYWIGLCAGLGAGAGVLLSGLAGAARAVSIAAGILALAAGVGIGLAVDGSHRGGWGDVVAGVLGGLAGALGAAQVVRGALRRGGTRGGTATLVAGAALLVAALALVPVLGYLEAVALPVLAARLRRRAPERYAGLRTLAKD